MLHININGKEYTAREDQTILAVAREHGIEIPTLCEDERVKIYGSCGLCVVETEQSPRLLRACSTLVSEGMIVRTDSERIRASRHTALELLLSDHKGDCRPPCATACPAQTDCQGYVGLIANGEDYEALKLILERIPLPGSIGRVCPHPCEKECRRKLVEDPINIAALKRYASEAVTFGGGNGAVNSKQALLEEIKTRIEAAGDTQQLPNAPKRVCVIGAGPGGLSAAYFLRLKGYEVTIIEAMPKAGGMLRYGIPEYRLPKRVLDEEIKFLTETGIKVVCNTAVGKDISLQELRDVFDAVIIATGAWKSSKLGCKGEDANGVVGGIDFLRAVSNNEPFTMGKKVAIVGGGNTAMDACRTAVRMGADVVYNIYRRTKNEMPAEAIEIAEAEEEGVTFMYLVNPTEIISTGGKVTGMRLQCMELGEPDQSGRRSPVPINGMQELLEVDTVIIAIGQGFEPKGFEDVKLTRRMTIEANERSFETNLGNVFAIGDATNKGAGIAVEAIAEAWKAAKAIDLRIQAGIERPAAYPDYDILVQRQLTEADFDDKEKVSRVKQHHLPKGIRKENFSEVTNGYTAEEARKEAQRCLECGCGDYYECKLIRYANVYGAQTDIYAGEKHSSEPDLSNPFFLRNPDKCILCGLCVRVCEEVMGVEAVGLVDRGFDTYVKPALETEITKTDCISCGQCVQMCPTGALQERLKITKPVPVAEVKTENVCMFCGMGCKTEVTSKGSMLLRSQGELCVNGRFGFTILNDAPRITSAYQSVDKSLAETSLYDACINTYKKIQGIKARHGAEAVAITVSDRYSNQEINAIKQFASLTGIEQVYCLNDGGDNMSTADFEQLERTDVVVAVGEFSDSCGMAVQNIKKAVENGAKLLYMGKNDRLVRIATQRFDLNESGINEAAAILEKAKKAVIIYEQQNVGAEIERMLIETAKRTNHLSGPRNGIIQLKANVNSYGLRKLGINTDAHELKSLMAQGQIKGLLVFGEDPSDVAFDGLEFLAVQDVIMTNTAQKAQIVLPGSVLWESGGTVVSTVGKQVTVRPVIKPVSGITNIEVIAELIKAAGGSKRIAYAEASSEDEACMEGSCSDSKSIGGCCTCHTKNTNAYFARFTDYMKKEGLAR